MATARSASVFGSDAAVAETLATLLADEDAQRNVLALGRFGRLDLAEPHRHAGRAAAHGHRVGGIGASLFGSLDQSRDTVGQFCCV